MSLIPKIIEYFRSAKQELSKVTWPSREQTVRYSALVIVVSLVVAGFFGMLDSGLSKAVTIALENRRLSPAPSQSVDVPTTETDSNAASSTEEKKFEFEDLKIVPDNGNVTADTEAQK